MNYLVTNRLPTSLTIEDIGVRLDGAGGSSSSRLLPEQTFNSSRQIREYERKKWISVEARAPIAKPSIPVWPFSAAPPAQPAPVPLAIQPPAVESAMLHGIMAKLDALLAREAAASTHTVVHHTSDAARPAQVKTSDEPMFIPSQIIPQSAEVNLNVQTKEADTEEFDAGLEALKKARKK